MKVFYSRPHALEFLDVKAATLQRAVSHGWIAPMRLGPKAHFKTEFFVSADLVEFRQKYRGGYYEPSAIRKRSYLRARGSLSG